MACKYKLGSSDSWMSEDEFKEALNNGLLDKAILDNGLKINGFKPKSELAKNFSTPTTTQVKESTPAKAKKSDYTPVKATIRGANIDGQYSSKVSEDGKTASIKDVNGKEIASKSPIKQTSTGRDYVVLSNGATIFVNESTTPLESKKEESVSKETKTENRGKRMEIMLPAEGNVKPRKMVFNKRLNQWMLEGKYGLTEVSEELQKRADLQYKIENNKLIPTQKSAEELKALEEEKLADMKKSAKGDKALEEVAESEDAKTAVEIDSTEMPEKSKKPKTKKNMATAKRGITNTFTEAVLNKLRSSFGAELNIYTDEDSFNAMADLLGRSRNEAAILVNGEIFLNPKVANNNTAFEEYAHVYMKVMEQANPAMLAKGIELIMANGQEYVGEVMNDSGYSDVHGGKKDVKDLTKEERKGVGFEAVSKMIADRAEQISEDRRKKPIREFLKDFWASVARVFGLSAVGIRGGKLDITKDTLENYVNKIARELSKGTPIAYVSSKELAKIEASGQADYNEKINPVVIFSNSVMTPESERTRRGRKWMSANRGVDESIAYKASKARREITLIQTRINSVVGDLNKAIDEYYSANKKKVSKVLIKQAVDRALKDPEFRTRIFSKYPEAERYLKPVVMKMRGMIDDMSEQLIKSGLMTQGVEASITQNNDMYVHASYHAFTYNHEGYTGNWLDLFSKEERDRITNWAFKSSAYKSAVSMDYTIKPDGKVEAYFRNSFGVTNDNALEFDSLKDFKTFLQENVTHSINDKSFLKKGQLKSMPDKQGQNTFSFGNPVNISKTGTAFKFNNSSIEEKLSSMVKAKEDLQGFIRNVNLIKSKSERGALKRKKKLDSEYRELLKEIKDPATNFATTVAKQAGLLHKGTVEQAIIDSGYLAVKDNVKGWVKVSEASSRLNGYYVSPELHEYLTGAGIASSKGTGSGIELLTKASALTKAYLTIFSIGSNAANYLSGYVQLAKTGNLPIGMVTAMKAVQKGFENKTQDEIASVLLNQVPTLIRAISNLATNTMQGGETGKMKNYNSTLSEDQKKFYGVSNYSELSPSQKANVMLEELISVGAISSNINAESIKELAEIAFGEQGMSPDSISTAMESKTKFVYNKITGAARRGTKSTFDAASASYSFTDSMFKAIMYFNTKARNMSAYGAVMKIEGKSDAEIEEAIREKTALQVRQQMPTYERSPEFLKWLSKFPFVGSFVQFDFQSKVNDKNIIKNMFEMIADGKAMMKKAKQESDPDKAEVYRSSASKLFVRSAGKMSGIGTSLFASTMIYKMMSMMLDWDDDKDRALREVMPDYRKYNTLLPWDGNFKGSHTYVDINRIDPQTLYHKYYTALTEDGFMAMVDEVLQPYISVDIFTGAVVGTLQNVDKYGNYSKEMEEMDFFEKIDYLLNERLLPGGTVGQVLKIMDSFGGGESSKGVSNNPVNELFNTFLGIKLRTIDMGSELAKRITYTDFKKIDNSAADLRPLISEKEKIEDQISRKVKGVGQADLDAINAKINEERLNAAVKANEHLEEARSVVNMYIKQGYTENEIRILLKEQGATRYLVNFLFNDKMIEYGEDGKIIANRRYSKPKVDRSFEEDFGDDLEDDLGEDFSEDLGD